MLYILTCELFFSRLPAEAIHASAMARCTSPIHTPSLFFFGPCPGKMHMYALIVQGRPSRQGREGRPSPHLFDPLMWLMRLGLIVLSPEVTYVRLGSPPSAAFVGCHLWSGRVRHAAGPGGGVLTSLVRRVLVSVKADSRGRIPHTYEEVRSTRRVRDDSLRRREKKKSRDLISSIAGEAKCGNIYEIYDTSCLGEPCTIGWIDVGILDILS